jgi:hypothetical protein
MQQLDQMSMSTNFDKKLLHLYDKSWKRNLWRSASKSAFNIKNVVLELYLEQKNDYICELKLQYHFSVRVAYTYIWKLLHSRSVIGLHKLKGKDAGVISA